MADSRASDDFTFNPFDPAQTQHMWELMARMRREQPVNRPTEGFVYVREPRRQQGRLPGREAVLVGRGVPGAGSRRCGRGELPR